MQQRSEPSQSAHCVRSQIPLFVTYGDIFPRSGGSLSSQGELFGIFRQVEQNLPLSGEVDLRSKDGEGSLQQAPSPSQALPRQIPPFVAARHLPPERGKSFLKGGAKP